LIAGTPRRPPLALHNKRAKLFKRHAQKTGVCVGQSLNEIEENIPILLGIFKNMAFGERHRIAASTRNDVVQVLSEQGDLVDRQKHWDLLRISQWLDIGLRLATGGVEIKKRKYLAGIGLRRRNYKQ
jgi:hypothetical protein